MVPILFACQQIQFLQKLLYPARTLLKSIPIYGNYCKVLVLLSLLHTNVLYWNCH
ncbi:hypothetical protein ANCCAN_29205, partial [Ancylostoma caninum]